MVLATYSPRSIKLLQVLSDSTTNGYQRSVSTDDVKQTPHRSDTSIFVAGTSLFRRTEIFELTSGMQR